MLIETLAIVPLLYLGGVNPEILPPPEPLVLEVVETSEEVCDMNVNPYCSCVKTARLLGLNVPPANARDLVPNIQYPNKGDGVLLSYTTDEHIAVILETSEEGFYIGEGNYKRGQYTERFIEWTDPHIRGYVRY